MSQPLELDKEDLPKPACGEDSIIENEASINLVKEAHLLLKIAIPTVAVQFSIYFIYPQTASAVGRNLGAEELAGFSLASLTGNMACLSVIMGVLTATDTLMPRAFATRRYTEVGRLAIRGFALSSLVLFIPVVLLSFCMDGIFDSLGQDPIVSLYASIWLRIYILGVPFVLLFRVIQRFLAAQHLVFPMVVAGVVGCFVVHPILLRHIVPSLGFVGSGLAVILTQFVQAMLVLVYLTFHPLHHSDTWPGLTWSFLVESIKPEPVLQFWRLSLGGVLSFSEWWFWEIICFIAGRLGVIPLCIHTIAYNLIPVMFMIPLGFSIGLSVRMGNVLATDVRRAKVLASFCMAFTIVVACFAALLLHHLRESIVALFTTDKQIKHGCEQIWGKVCIYIALLYIFGINSGIMRALGLQLRMAAVIFSILWCCALPTLFHFALRQGGGINAIWSILPCFYFLMNLVLAVTYSAADWHAISDEIRKRADQTRRASLEIAAAEQTSLLTGEP